MTRTDRIEAERLVALICARLSALPNPATTSAAAELRRLAGAASADAGRILRDGTQSARLLACFDAARAAGVGFGGFESLRAELAATTPTGPIAQSVRADGIRRCLAQMARVLAATTFASREAASAAQAKANFAFGAAEDDTLDAQDTETYRAVVALHAAVTRDLTTRGRQLPRAVKVTSGSALPALVLAQRLYGDAGRADELVAGNRAVSPLFMPRTIEALSA